MLIPPFLQKWLRLILIIVLILITIVIIPIWFFFVSAMYSPFEKSEEYLAQQSALLFLNEKLMCLTISDGPCLT